MEKTMDRRDFLLGMGAGGLAMAGAGLLGGCAAPAPEGAAQAKAAPDEGGASDGAPKGTASTAPIEPVGVPQAWDKEADVVVVGMGGGGLNAASRARQLGLSVIIIDKLARPGGNSQSATMFTIGGGTPEQDAVGFATPSFPYEVDKWVDHMMTGLGQGGNPEMLRLIGENMPKCFSWMTETYGLEWTMGPNASYFFVQQDGMTKIIDAASSYAQGEGAEFIQSCEAQALVMDGDRVVGVKAKQGDGSEIFLHGSKAVLLTGGGFAANKDLLAEHCPSALERAKACYLANTDTGECFRMGLGAGADIVNRNCYTMFDGGMDWEGHGGEWCHYLFDGATQLVRQPWLAIKKDGSRIRYIDIMESMGALTDLAAVQSASPGGESYVVFDGRWDDYLKGVENYMSGFCQYECRMPVQDGMYKQADIPEYYQDYHQGVQDAIDAGVICECDTLEELARELGLDEEVLGASVEKWNDMVASGKDDFVYPYKEQWLHPISEPPFYGAKLGGFLFMTQTGLLVNTKMQVVSSTGAVIPGLYAGWHTAGGAGAPDTVTSMTFDTGGVSKSYLGGYLAAGFIAEEE